MKIIPKTRMNIPSNTSIRSISHHAFTFAAWTLLSVFTGFADIGEPSAVTVTSWAFSATAADGTNSFAHSLVFSSKMYSVCI